MHLNQPKTILSTPTPGLWKNCLPQSQFLVPERLETCLSRACLHLSILWSKNKTPLLPNQMCLLLLALTTLGRRTLVGEGSSSSRSSPWRPISFQHGCPPRNKMPTIMKSLHFQCGRYSACISEFVSLSSPFTMLFPAINCAVCKLLDGFVERLSGAKTTLN